MERLAQSTFQEERIQRRSWYEQTCEEGMDDEHGRTWFSTPTTACAPTPPEASRPTLPLTTLTGAPAPWAVFDVPPKISDLERLETATTCCATNLEGEEMDGVPEAQTPSVWSSRSWSDYQEQHGCGFSFDTTSTDVPTTRGSSSRQSLQSSPRNGRQSLDSSPRFQSQDYTVFRTFIHLQKPSEDDDPETPILNDRSLSSPADLNPPSRLIDDQSPRSPSAEAMPGSSPEPVQDNDSEADDDLEIQIVELRTFVHIHIPNKFFDEDDQPVASPSTSAPSGLSKITTIRIRGLNHFWRRDDMVRLLQEKGWSGLFDFVYMPMNFRCNRGGSNFGYAFVNLRDHWHASELIRELNNDPEHSFDAAPASEFQGLTENVDKWKNDSVMHYSVPDECKPAMYDARGNRVTFPKHTKKLSKPRVRGNPYWDTN